MHSAPSSRHVGNGLKADVPGEWRNGKTAYNSCASFLNMMWDYGPRHIRRRAPAREIFTAGGAIRQQTSVSSEETFVLDFTGYYCTRHRSSTADRSRCENPSAVKHPNNLLVRMPDAQPHVRPPDFPPKTIIPRFLQDAAFKFYQLIRSHAVPQARRSRTIQP